MVEREPDTPGFSEELAASSVRMIESPDGEDDVRNTLVCFFSTPYNDKKHLDIMDSIIELVSRYMKGQSENGADGRLPARFAYSLELLRLDDAPFTAPDIHANVLNGIRGAHIMIADVSPRGYSQESREKGKGKAAPDIPNASVMHEIGIATALEMPIFLVGNPNAPQNPPANLRSALVTVYPDNLGDLVGDEVYQKCKSGDRAHRRRLLADQLATDPEVGLFVKSLGETIMQNIVEKGAPPRQGEYRVRGFSQRRRVELPRLIREARFRIHILTTNLEYVNERFLRDIESALSWNLLGGGNNPSFKIDILTMDPESVVTNARAKQLNEDVARYRDRLRRSLKFMRDFRRNFAFENKTSLTNAKTGLFPSCMKGEILAEHPIVTLEGKERSPEDTKSAEESIYANFEINTYVTLPTMIMFLIDNTVVCSTPSPSQQSRLGPHFVVHDRNATLHFESHFFSVKSQSGGQVLL